MTEPAENPLVSYVIATYNRPDDLADAVGSVLEQEYRPIEVVVVSSSTDDTSALFEEGGRFDRDCVRYHHFEERMGVPEARNIGFEHSSGEIFVTIDDDAVLADPDATDTVVSLFEEHPDVGVLAFQSRSYRTGDVQLNETPDPPEFHMDPTQQYRATNFVGVGNAIRRSALEAAGDYPDDFVYGFEEMDLSFRVHDAGYDILYTPDVVVYHKKSPEARKTPTEIRERLVENRIRLAIRNLPWRYVLFTALVWSIYGAVLTRSLSSVWRISRRLYDSRRDLLDDRTVVDGRTIARVKSRNALLFFWWYGPHPRRFLGRNGNLRRLTWETGSP